ncbi:hypothetical protein RB195_023272 [Necator americanus]|uniref:Uncharacterized protein n=1 Tax=Necator americanus TaxID=51031 RepID=A0ABR1EJ28_NECAM
MWQRYSKPVQLAVIDFKAACDSPNRGRLLNALRADGVPAPPKRSLTDLEYVENIVLFTKAPGNCHRPCFKAGFCQ